MLRNDPDRGDIIRSLPAHLRDKLFPVGPPPGHDWGAQSPPKALWETYWDPSGNPTGTPLPDWPQQYTPTGGGFKPAENISDIVNPPASGGGLAQAPAPQPVTGHAASPWGASISDFFNNDNWTRQYEGTNPRTGEPISVGNWYTPGGASAAPVNAAPTAAGGSAINNDPRVQELADKFRNDVWRDRGPQTVVPVGSLDTQDKLDVPFRVDQSQDATPVEKPPWYKPGSWKQVGDFLGETWEGAKNIPNYLPKKSIPIISTLPPETRATEALNYQYLPPSTQQLLFMQDAGIGRKGPVDRRELGLRRNDLSRLMRYGGMDPGDWGG